MKFGSVVAKLTVISVLWSLYGTRTIQRLALKPASPSGLQAILTDLIALTLLHLSSKCQVWPS
jgi:hypothetical protein